MSRKQQMQPHKADPLAAAEWYVVSDDGESALRVTPGLQLGETDAGDLTLNDPARERRWIEFDLGDDCQPFVGLVSGRHVMELDGERVDRQPVYSGLRLILPNNTLYVSRDFAVPRRDGPEVRVSAGEAAKTVDTGTGGHASEPAAAMQPAATPADVATSADVGGPAGDWAARVEDLAARASRAAATGDLARPRGAPATGARARPSSRDLLPEPSAEPESSTEPPRSESSPRTDRRVTPPRPRARRRPRHPRRSRAPAWLFALAGVVVALAVALVRYPEHPLMSRLQTAADEAVAAAGAFVAGSSAGVDSMEEASAGAEGSAAASPEAAASSEAAGSGQTGAPPAAPEVVGEIVVPPVRARLDAMAAPSRAAPAEKAPAAMTAPADPRLDRARTLLEQGRLTYPPGSNAVAVLQEVLSEHPEHPVALAMLEECSTRLVEAAVQAHEAGLDYEARNTLEEVLGFAPDSSRARELWRQWVGTEF